MRAQAAARLPQAALRVWGDEDCATVHQATLRLLAETGVEMRHERARDLCAAAGAHIEGTRVRLPAALVEQALASAPRSSWLTPRGGSSEALELTSGRTYYGTGPDCLYVADAETGARRRARLADVKDYARLSDRLPHIDFVMSMGLPEDVPNEVVDLAQFAAMLAGTSKPIVVSSPFAGASLHAMHEMAALCGEAASFACLAMSSPPLTLDEVALDKLLTCAALSIPLVLAPAPSAGSTAPASVPAVVTVGNAEVVAGLVVHQLARPGAPFVYGAGVGVLNMRTAVEVYLAPEAALGDQAACDLARSYGLPSWSYAGMSDSKLLDEQAALEAGLASVFGALSGATLLHDVGYLESGMQSSFEALVLGNEIIGYVKAFLTPLPVSSDTLQLDEIMAVGPGGNHLARPYTRQHHRLLWQADLLDQNMFERWQADGATTLRERVKARTAALCAAAPTFSLDPALEARLQRIVAEALRAAGD